MAGEMIYILEQRIKDRFAFCGEDKMPPERHEDSLSVLQRSKPNYRSHPFQNQKNISEEKGDLVLHDIISQTLKQKYLHEIFKINCNSQPPFRPQNMFSRRHMRAMFERLAHSSIMRLSESSMEKLFDLTLMMTKYQIQSVVMPEQILTVTMNHLSGMRRIAKQEDDIQELIRNAHAMFLMLYGPVPVTEWNLIRHQMLNFFQDCRVKVSVLLRDEKQFDDGHFVYLPQKSRHRILRIYEETVAKESARLKNK
ncbi:hypothetical protein ANCDUO_14059 [Ancylostoma duodenale]|uniref:Uncharacterized protein n=1 Tax=Ancylostoma duodenale TaxID=51022 RepID=A0A0C2CHC6_9BILA|nr:hypothetical protein ANCDUO_14059 [Ancylostoma duodenale]